MSTQDREALFKAANAKRVQDKQQKEQQKGSYGKNTYDTIYAPLFLDEASSFRILGYPPDLQIDDPTSPKVVFYSMILGDDERKFRCIWPNPENEEGRNWVLWRLYRKVMSYTWDSDNNRRNYHNQSSHPILFNRIFKNSRPDIPFERGWNPSKLMIMNVISRDMYDLHKEKEKTAILCKKCTPISTGGNFYDVGIPYMVFESIWDDIVSIKGDWENYDVVIKKLDKSPFYKVYHGVQDFNRFSENSDKFDSDYLKIAERMLTEEERSWKREDLDKMFQVTTARKLLSRLGLFVEQVDETFHTNFHDELSRLAEKEMEAYVDDVPVPGEEENPDFDSDREEMDNFVETNSSIFEDEEDTEPEKKSPIKVRTKKSSSSTVDFDTLAETYVGIKDMTEEEKSMVRGFDSEKGTFLYDPDKELYECSNYKCTMRAPEEFHLCPGCGILFD